MSAQVFYDEPADTFRVRDEHGTVMGDGAGNLLAFDSQQQAQEMLARRAEMRGMPVRKLTAQ